MLKVCLKCHKSKPLEANFFFRKDTQKYRNQCKECNNPKKEWGKGKEILCLYCSNSFIKTASNQKYCSSNCTSNDFKHKKGISKTKWTKSKVNTCGECGVNFKPNNKNPYQKFCCRRHSNTHRQREYRKKKPEKVRLIEQTRYEKHKEKRNASARAYGKTPKGKINKLKGVWKRVATLKNIIQNFTDNEFRAKIHESKGYCPGVDIKSLKILRHYNKSTKWELDHIYPITKADEDFKKTGVKRVYTIKDVQPLCRSCNSKKYNKV